MTVGIDLHISAMWVSGILQGLMWRAYTKLGFLEYSFIETVEAMHPFDMILVPVARSFSPARCSWSGTWCAQSIREELAPIGQPTLAPGERGGGQCHSGADIRFETN